MRNLCRNTLDELGYNGYLNTSSEEKILQIGDGNFLRGFADYMFDVCCEKGLWNGKIAVVQPVSKGKHYIYEKQDGLYTLYTKGILSGKKISEKRIISSISRCLDFHDYREEIYDIVKSDSLEYIISNTTEAGIVYDQNCKFEDEIPKTFPAKLTKMLYCRYKAGCNGVIILSCELIDKNGDALKDIMLKHVDDWQLGNEFATWLNQDNLVLNTLVDRIVPGGITDDTERKILEKENGYVDQLGVSTEVFYSWVIEGPDQLKERLPMIKAGMNVKIVDDITPYKQRKVRILNGAHTGICLGSYLAGEEIVRDSVNNSIIGEFLNKMIKEEIVETLDFPRKELIEFADIVIERFKNPYIDHKLLSIALNSTSKWKARNLPSLLKYVELTNKLPRALTMSLAFYIEFYRRMNSTVKDDEWVIEFFKEHANTPLEQMAEEVLGNIKMWGMDLNEIPGLTSSIKENLKIISENGPIEAMKSCCF